MFHDIVLARCCDYELLQYWEETDIELLAPPPKYDRSAFPLTQKMVSIVTSFSYSRTALNSQLNSINATTIGQRHTAQKVLTARIELISLPVS